MTPQKVHLESRRFVGISCRTKNADERDPATGKIGPLYNRFFAEEVGANVPEREDYDSLFGVYFDYESDHHGAYSLMVAVDSSPTGDIPEGLECVDAAAGEYLVFEEAGELPGVVQALWQRIWDFFEQSTEYRRAFTIDFEQYSEAFPGVRIHIALAE